MARPRKDAPGLSAVDRMVDAFWEALEEKPYAEVTVGEIARRAEVNRNAVYYHFDNLDDLAAFAVDGMLVTELPLLVLESLHRGENPLKTLFLSGAVAGKFDKAMLIMGPHGSPYLGLLLRKAFTRAWGEAVGVDLDCAPQEMKLALEFLLGGLSAMITLQAVHPDERVMDAFVQTDFAQGVFQSGIRALEGAAGHAL